MELKQADVFGGYKLVEKRHKPKKLVKNQEVKEKIKLLYELYEKLYDKQNIDLFEQRDIIIKGNIICYPNDRQAEPAELTVLSIEEVDKKIQVMKKTLNDGF